MALESTYLLSEEKIEAVRNKLPNSPGRGTEECLKRCNIDSSIKTDKVTTKKSKKNMASYASFCVPLSLILLSFIFLTLFLIFN